MRSEERKAVSYPAWIQMDSQLRRCRVEDISSGGAMLRLTDPASLPENVRLIFSPWAKNYRQCQVRWRRDDSVGVLFTEKVDVMGRQNCA